MRINVGKCPGEPLKAKRMDEITSYDRTLFYLALLQFTAQAPYSPSFSSSLSATLLAYALSLL